MFANEQFAVTLVAETGRHANTGGVFDNRAIYLNRLDRNGKLERFGTVDLDSEAMEQFGMRTRSRTVPDKPGGRSGRP